MIAKDHVPGIVKTRIWCLVFVLVIIVMETVALNGPNVCMVKQKYNITKRIKYRAPMAVRTYEWCFSMPPRCSKWSTEMRDLTRLETEERTAEVAVCCAGYKMEDVSCVPICPTGRTGPGCSENCPANKWGPNCVNDCKKCKNGFCSPLTGDCECVEGWQGESCDVSMPKTTSASLKLEEILTTIAYKPTLPNTTPSTQIPITTEKMRTVPVTTISSTTTGIPSTTQAMKVFTTEFSTSPTKLSSTPMVLTPNTSETKTERPVTTVTFIRPIEATKTTKIMMTTEAFYTTFNLSPPVTTTMKTAITTEQEVIAKSNIGSAYSDIKTQLDTTTAKEPILIQQNITTNDFKEPEVQSTTIEPTRLIKIIKDTTLKPEVTKKEVTTKIPTTIKFKPKEIWIRPAQKGESPIVETKSKPVHDVPRYRSANHKDFTPANTTPKTIIVSIIPTSVSYSTFKKIALTTASYINNKNSSAARPSSKIGLVSTTPTIMTSTRQENNKSNSPTTGLFSKELSREPSTFLPLPSSTAKTITITMPPTAPITISISNKTNSMVTDDNTKNVSTSNKEKSYANKNISKLHVTKLWDVIKSSTYRTTPFVKYVPYKHVTTPVANQKSSLATKATENMTVKSNVTNTLTKLTTENPSEDEEFHILTEPEHITAVMGEKSTNKSSMDLISVISIAGGVMMAVITVAVLIVMIERCKKPRYEDVRKVNDMRMRVMIDDNDEPPPYVRSIFHTPLPDPPTDKCHYQPITTLDRNLKQFMRPVVVQTISPVMLENFRGILECHYDHLPRRSNDFAIIQSRCSIAPSIKETSELHHLRASLTESTIEALKCQAKQDTIDNTTSEPLYAEIPCWRPPSEHAVEILNLNGEAVTEL